MDSDSSSSSSSSKNSEEIDFVPRSRRTVHLENTGVRLVDTIKDFGPMVRRWMYDHAVQSSNRNLQCIINENCTFLCTSSEALISHLKLAHNFNVGKICLDFPSMSEFNMWKVKEEFRARTMYLYSGVQKGSSGKVYNLRCQITAPLQKATKEYMLRDYRGEPTNPESEYAERAAICPASIEVTEFLDGTVKAIYHFDHLGHNWEDELAGNMNMNPGRHDKREKQFSRFNFPHRRDVNHSEENETDLERNLERDCKMIDTWIKKLNLEGAYNTPVVYYRPLSKFKDYMMIIIHEVQIDVFMHAHDECILYVKIAKGEENVDLNMTTVTIITKRGESFPIAFCLSRKIEYVTLYCLYHTIYRNYGMIKPKFFVSDNLGQSYMAWKKIMLPIMSPKICVFNLESIWKQMLTRHNVPEEKQHRATAQLKSLLYELDKQTFAEQLNQTMDEWYEDETMKMFATCFQREYAYKCEEWAACFRTRSSDPLRTIDVHIEPVNDILEAIYMETSTGMIDFINCLMAYIRDSCLLKVIEWDENYHRERIRITQRNHAEGTQISSVTTQGSEWCVSEDGFDYVIKKIINNCNQDCGIFCGDCNVCVHQYSCPCKDYEIDFNLCKHIHAARLVMPRDEETEETTREAERRAQVVENQSESPEEASLSSLSFDAELDAELEAELDPELVAELEAAEQQEAALLDYDFGNIKRKVQNFFNFFS